MSEQNATPSTINVPEGFTPAAGFDGDDAVTLWQHQGIDTSGVLSIGAYWTPEDGHEYNLDVSDRNASYTLGQLRAARDELQQFIEQAEAVERR